MQKIKLTPDDVLMGAGSYRDEITIECPLCDNEITLGRDENETECDCGEVLELEKPFA
ncbi:MAG: hypothetical protein SXQ77_00530 [Halobacteria archaeon]|nr:hypothetical protein [Halobacteria archaeon]